MTALPRCVLCSQAERYAARYNAANSLSSHGDALRELASLRPELVSGLRRLDAGAERDAGGKTARDESAGAEPRAEPLAISAEGSAVHPHPERHDADAASGAIGAPATTGARGHAARARAGGIRSGRGEPTVLDRGQQLRGDRPGRAARLGGVPSRAPSAGRTAAGREPPRSRASGQ